MREHSAKGRAHCCRSTSTAGRVPCVRATSAAALLLLLLLLTTSIAQPLLAWLARAALSSPRVLLLAQYGTWGTPGELAHELFFLERSLHPVRLQPLPWWLPSAAQLGAADLVVCSVFRPRQELLQAMHAHPQAVWVFVSGENLVHTVWWDHLGSVADVSLGQRQSLEGQGQGQGQGAHYLRIPWWLPYALDRTQPGCALPPHLAAATGPGAAAAWAARPRLALLLSRHANFPRPQLHAAFSALGPVDAPGSAFHSMPWPAHLPDSPEGKLALLGSYRFSLCPENSASTPALATPGYTTEKFIQAHLAGAIPVHWGDALDAAVWNGARVLRLSAGGEQDPALPNATAALMGAVAALDGSAGAREAFFAQPVLAPGAEAWVAGWCHTLGGMLREAVARKRKGGWGR